MSQADKIYDIAIVGCGPAGLSAAVNARTRNADFILLGSEFCSPKLYKAEKVDNYLGFQDISGEELRAAFLKHVNQMGISLEHSRVDNIYPQGDYYTLMSRNQTYQAYTVILATGVSYTRFLEGEEGLVGSGVSYCATCDAPLYKGKDVAVIAYTNEGIEEAEYLAEVAGTVYLLPQVEVAEELYYSNIKLVKSKPLAIRGKGRVESVELKDRSINVDGVFIFREITPPDRLIYGLELTDRHIKVDENMATNLEGVFAAGDCTGTPYQLGRAVGQGQVAALNAVAYARKKKKEINNEEVMDILLQ